MGDQNGPIVSVGRSYGELMTTLSADPDATASRQAALAAHDLRQALDRLGMLPLFPQCQAVADGGPKVRLGDIDAAAATQLAEQLTRAAQSCREPHPTDE